MKLKLEDLAVESFNTLPEAPKRRGTVRGNASLDDTQCDTRCNTWCCEASWNGQCISNGGGACGGTNAPCAGTNVQTCNGWPGSECGTCYPLATCDLQEGCGGNSMDMQIC
ncbi:MAG TPA: hypothetical protein VFR81_04220 [Longimicrobium sp.]|nr:hypothetical protein [Longimicrobium sp.]